MDKVKPGVELPGVTSRDLLAVWIEVVVGMREDP